MADTMAQSLVIHRGIDATILLSGDFSQSPAGWGLQFTVARNRGKAPALIITTPTITVTGTGPYVATIPLTRAQTAALTHAEYDFELTRTDAGSVSPKAGGTLKIVDPVYPLPE